MQKIRIECFECFHIALSKRSFFYLDLSRSGTKEEKEARRQFAKILTQEKTLQGKKHWYHQDIEGTGYQWRLEASVVRKYAHQLDLPCSVDEELKRYRVEGPKMPDEPIRVTRFQINIQGDGEFIWIGLESLNERLRRAMDQWIVDHGISRKDFRYVNTYGASITITHKMLNAFKDHLIFDKPLAELIKEERIQAQKRKEEEKQREADWARRREEAGKRRDQSWEECWQQYQESFFRQQSEGRNHYEGKVSIKSKGDINGALKIFSLDKSTATAETIKKRYRELAKKSHPDVGGNAEEFKKINNANEVLMSHFK